MAGYQFEDALTGCSISFASATSNATLVAGEGELAPCSDLFFPGCSFINYGLPLVQAVYDTLKTYQKATGISLLCCGKILAFEPDGKRVRVQFEEQLVDHLAKAKVQRVVAACPNCVKAMRDACAKDPRTAQIQFIPLAKVLADIGYRIPADTAAAVAAPFLAPGAKVCFAPHDSCPDKETGEFASAMRTLMQGNALVEPEHNRKSSICCGSLPRAAGKMDQAKQCAQRNGDEAVAAGANAIVTPCVSCSLRLSMDQKVVPVFHYLELLYNWRIDWSRVDEFMKIRFLFEGSYGVQEDTSAKSNRKFVSMPPVRRR